MKVKGELYVLAALLLEKELAVKTTRFLPSDSG
jgi:hypothetical protein